MAAALQDGNGGPELDDCSATGYKNVGAKQRLANSLYDNRFTTLLPS